MSADSVCPTCPKCSSRDVRRSKRKGFLERTVLDLAALRPYRCRKCDHRFFRFGRHNGDRSSSQAPLAHHP